MELTKIIQKQCAFCITFVLLYSLNKGKYVEFSFYNGGVKQWGSGSGDWWRSGEASRVAVVSNWDRNTAYG